LDLYKFFHEDGRPGHATGLVSFTFISQVGMKVFLKNCTLPPALEKFAGQEGTVMNEPEAKRSPRDNDMFDISFPAPSKRGGQGKVTRKVRRQFLEFVVDTDDTEKKELPEDDVSTRAPGQSASSSKDGATSSNEAPTIGRTPQKPEVRIEGNWKTETMQRIQPIIDEVIRIIINIGSTNHFETRIVSDLQSLNKDIDKKMLQDKAVWDGRAVEIKNSTGKLLCTITPASQSSEMSSPPDREASEPDLVPDLDPGVSDSPPSGGAGNEMVVEFNAGFDAKDHERVQPTVNKVKRILAKIGSVSSEDFEKKLEAELAIINKNKKGIKATWQPLAQYIDISDAHKDGICDITPPGVDPIEF